MSQICLITGANAGVGRMAALGLAQRGATVLLGCRNAESARETQRSIIAATQNNNVYTLDLDLAQLDSVYAAAAEVENRFGRLDVLINNAAVYDPTQSSPQLTSDGFEAVFATNFIGHAVLSLSLLPLLKNAKPGRVLSISDQLLDSKGNLRINLEDSVTLGKKSYNAKRAYIHSKVALEAWTLALAQHTKTAQLTANVLRIPPVQIEPDRLDHFSFFRRQVVSLSRKWAMSRERAAAAYVALALSETYTRTSGKVFTADLQTTKPARKIRQRKQQDLVWTWTNTLIADSLLV